MHPIMHPIKLTDVIAHPTKAFERLQKLTQAVNFLQPALVLALSAETGLSLTKADVELLAGLLEIVPIQPE